MTDAAQVTANTVSLPTIGHGPEYREKHIWLPQMFMESARDKLAIENRRFIGCVIEGPAVLLPMNGCNFDSCDMGLAHGDVRNLLLTAYGPERVTGIVPVHGCLFQNCKFVGVGFTGPVEFLENFVRSLNGTAA